MAKLGTLLKARFLRFRREIILVGYAIRHSGTPLHLRLAGLVLILYLLSPIDLIPIMIPIIGLLDDLIIVPWGISVVVRNLPADVREESNARAERWVQRFVKRPLLYLAGAVVLLIAFWVGVIWLLFALW